MNVCLSSRRREVAHSIFKEPGKPHGTCHRSHCSQAADDPDYLTTDNPGNASLLLRGVCLVGRGTTAISRHANACRYETCQWHSGNVAHSVPDDYAGPFQWLDAFAAAAYANSG